MPDDGPEIHGPYDFVPLADQVRIETSAETISHDVPFADGLSGRIRFTIHTETPLVVGGERTRASTAAPGIVRMFRLPGNGEPAIPGSSIRGMVRNVFEILSFSKFGFIDDKRFAIRDLTRAMWDSYGRHMTKNDNGRYTPKSLAGFLTFSEKSGWAIQRCEYARIFQSGLPASCRWFQKPNATPSAPQKYKDLDNAGFALGAERHFEIDPPAFHQLHAGGEIWYAEARLADATTPNAKPGVLVVTGQPSDKKRREFVFHDRRKGDAVRVPDDVMQRFLDVQRQLVDRSDEPEGTAWGYLLTAYRAGRIARIPVFYLTEEPPETSIGRAAEAVRVTQIGLSMMFPLPYAKSIADLRPSGHGDLHGFDLAEAVFGRVSKERGGSLKGRVSFSLARPAAATTVNQPGNPVILSSPKASFQPAYLEQRGDARGRLVGNSYATFDSLDARLSGWKRYPARAQASPQVIPPDLVPKKQIQTRLETVPRGARFDGEFRFHNLRPYELGGVLLALTLGLDGQRCHTLGGGKPNGYGTVRIAIDETEWAARIEPNALARDPETGRFVAAAPPTAAALIASFEASMEAWATGARVPHGWRKSDPVSALFGLADPTVTADRNFAYMNLQAHRAAKGAWDNPKLVRRPIVPRSASVPASAAPRATPAGQAPALRGGRPPGPASNVRPAPADFQVGDSAYWEGEKVEVLEVIASRDGKSAPRARIRRADGDEMRVSASELQRKP